MTYQEAYNKIIDAYFKDEIRPFNKSFCFCGTLSNGEDWSWGDNNWGRNYSVKEYGKMEAALFSTMPFVTVLGVSHILRTRENYTEDELFEGMSRALDVLKQIHIERGEIIDEVPVFTKRQIHA